MEHISNIIDEVIQQEITPIKSGIKFLDETLGGYYPGEMTTICGDINSGKTAIIIAQINHLAVDQHIPTLLVLNNMTIDPSRAPRQPSSLPGMAPLSPLQWAPHHGQQAAARVRAAR